MKNGENLKEATREVVEQVKSGNYDARIDVKRFEDREELYLIEFINALLKEIEACKESFQALNLELESIVDNTSSGIIMLTPSKNIGAINNVACSILNMELDQLYKKPYRELFKNIDSEELQIVINSLEEKELTSVKKEVAVKINDKHKILSIFMTNLSGTQQIISYLIIIEDITEIIISEKILINYDLVKALARHIQNPLTPIKLSIERIQKKWEQRSTDFDQILQRSSRTILGDVASLDKMAEELIKFMDLPSKKK